ncbi:MAG: ATP-dependent zinc metalloprotease FtsH [Dehalococcoidia bacterium]
MPQNAMPQKQDTGSGWSVTNSIFVVAFVIVAILTIYLWMEPAGEDSSSEIGIGQVLSDAREDKISRILVSGEDLTVEYPGTDGAVITRTSRLPESVDLVALLQAEGVALSRSEGTTPALDLVFENSQESSELATWLGVLLNILPFLLVFGFLYLILKRSAAAPGEAMKFGKSGARLIAPLATGVRFDDVAGVDEAKQELAEVVEFLKVPQKFAALGARIPRGILLLGPPGTGKTLLARAVAGEAEVPFFSISASEFVEMFVGVGASRVRDLFAEAKKNAPCIVFLDEIDAVGRQRGLSVGGAHDEREQTLNQILVEMDGFEPGTNVVVLAATNRPDILDPALVRPGRFDRKVVLDPPDLRGREAILKVHLRGKPIAEDVSAEILAKTTPGFTGADLANLVNEAAILDARRDSHAIDAADFAEAADRVLAGPERKSRLLSEHERRIVAVHESAHAVVAHLLEHHDRPQKVTIIPRGTAAGYTRFLPEAEDHFKTPEAYTDELTAELAGHAAEELVFGSASTGPANDLEQATRLARAMVMRWGMSDAIGPLFLGRGEDAAGWYREEQPRSFSEDTARQVDAEVRRLVVQARERAFGMLTEHRPLLDRLATKLLEVETLQQPELGELLNSMPAEAESEPAQRSFSPATA